MDFSTFIIKSLRRIYVMFSGVDTTTSGLVEYSQQNGNDFIYHSLLNNEKEGKGMMIVKFGTYELGSLVSYIYNFNKDPKMNFWDFKKLACVGLDFKKCLSTLALNAGMFPETLSEGIIVCEEYRKLLGDIDILASYQYSEKALLKAMPSCRYVDLDAFYAPFKFENPWTQWLEGKKVLVVHPFVESIKKQYETKRERLFDNPLVLPKFKSLDCIKAVQSAAGNIPEEFSSWHEALEYMKSEIAKKDFDVALIGCGAYGMPLAAFVKSLGKVGIQLAGWTQMLFGVYGERWISQQTQYSKFINKYWIRPNENETPRKAKDIESGCYW